MSEFPPEIFESGLLKRTFHSEVIRAYLARVDGDPETDISLGEQYSVQRRSLASNGEKERWGIQGLT